MMSSGIKNYPTYIGDYNHPRTGNPKRKNRIKWNDRGILNTAHLLDGMSGHPEIYRTIFIGLGWNVPLWSMSPQETAKQRVLMVPRWSRRMGRVTYQRFDHDLLKRYTKVAWYKYLSFLGMDQGYGSLSVMSVEMYGSWLWGHPGSPGPHDRWIGALHVEPPPMVTMVGKRL